MTDVLNTFNFGDTLDSADPDLNYFSNINPVDRCQYYSLPEFSLLESNSHIFSILNYNVRSFHANGSIFETMLDSLKHSFKCIVVSET